MKQVSKVTGPKREVKIYFSKVYDEYTLKVYSIGGLRLIDEDYYTDDKDDAIGTAELIAG